MTEKLYRYVEEFNRNDEELYPNEIKNAEAYEFLKGQIPLFECPDEQFERTYYFRWWTFRKHIRHTESGYVLTEFLCLSFSVFAEPYVAPALTSFSGVIHGLAVSYEI